jgi:hypothetical protein
MILPQEKECWSVGNYSLHNSITPTRSFFARPVVSTIFQRSSNDLPTERLYDNYVTLAIPLCMNSKILQEKMCLGFFSCCVSRAPFDAKEGDDLCLDNEIWSVRENVDEPTLTNLDNILKDN